MIVSSQLVRAQRRPCPARSGAAKLPPGVLRWMETSIASRPSSFCAALSGTAGRSSRPRLDVDERSSTDLEFPMWIYYLCGAAGRRPADVRCATRSALVRFAVPLRSGDHDRWSQYRPRPQRHGRARRVSRPPASLEHDDSYSSYCSSGCSPAGCRSSWCSGVLGGMLYLVSGQPLVGAAQLVIDKLNSPTLMALPLFVMAATFMRFGGIAKALVDLLPPGSAASADRSASSPWWPARCSRRSAARASRPRWRWGRS